MDLEPKPLVLFVGDPHRGVDVPVLLRVLRMEHLSTMLRVGCVVAIGERPARGAGAARGLLGDLPVPVGVGAEVGDQRADSGPDPFIWVEPDHSDGHRLLRETLERAEDRANLPLTPPFTDIAGLIRGARPLLTPKHVVRVTIFGLEGDDPFDDRLDPHAAGELNGFLLHGEIPTTVVTPAAAAAYAVHLDVLEEVAQTADEIGRWLVEMVLDLARSTNHPGRGRAPLAARRCTRLRRGVVRAIGAKGLVALERDPGSSIAVCRAGSEAKTRLVISSMQAALRFGLRGDDPGR